MSPERSAPRSDPSRVGDCGSVACSADARSISDRNASTSAAPRPAFRPDTCAIVAAGGLGLRFGDPRGKQYVEVCGLPVLDWSIAAFDEAPSVGHVVVVCPRGRVDDTRRAVRRVSPGVPVSFVSGGATRQESCLAGLRAVPGGFPLVAIHDGARPLVSPETIEAVIARVREDPTLAGAICAHPSIDTLKVVEGDMVRSTPDRSQFWSVQTPQVFRLDVVVAAHEAAAREGFVGTDDSSLVERAGGRVACVKSPSDNIKVTVPEDRRPVEAILSGRLQERVAEKSLDDTCLGETDGKSAGENNSAEKGASGIFESAASVVPDCARGSSHAQEGVS